MSDTFSEFSTGLSSPPTHAFAITASNTAGLSYTTRGIYVGVSGDLAVVMAGGETVTFPSVAAGVLHPLRCSKVLETGTDASGIVGVY